MQHFCTLCVLDSRKYFTWVFAQRNDSPEEGMERLFKFLLCFWQIRVSPCWAQLQTNIFFTNPKRIVEFRSWIILQKRLMTRQSWWAQPVIASYQAFFLGHVTYNFACNRCLSKTFSLQPSLQPQSWFCYKYPFYLMIFVIHDKIVRGSLDSEHLIIFVNFCVTMRFFNFYVKSNQFSGSLENRDRSIFLHNYSVRWKS